MESVSATTTGLRAYNDSPGLLVIPESPQPVFSRFGATAIGGRNGDVVTARVREAFSQHTEPDGHSLLACEMYAASHFMPSGDSRFLMLMIAVEALIEAETRPAAQVEAIDGLVKHLACLSLSQEEQQSLSQAIDGLKKESINSAAKRLAATLGDRKYADKSPKKFFEDCYEARSNLVHGNLDRRPDADVIRGLIGHLEHFVRDLVLERNGLASIEDSDRG